MSLRTRSPDEAPGGIDRRPYFPHVDGLRALAVVAVVAYHGLPGWIPGGFTGVDVFFVVSGFVVSGSVDRLRVGSLRELATYFYARRVVRILPALVVSLLTTYVAAALFIPHAWLSDANEKTAISAFFGASNLVLVSVSRNYFSPSVEFNPFTHTWSLGVEEQFYALFPVASLAWVRSDRRHPWRSTWVYAALLACSFGAAFLLSRSSPISAFYSIASRFWELAVGVLLFQTSSRWAGWIARRPPAVLEVGSWSMLALVGSGFAFADPRAFPVPWAILPVAGTAGLLLLSHATHAQPTPRRLLGSRVLVAIGKGSYSIYLWHWPVLVFFRWTVGLETMRHRVVALAVGAALACGSYFLVERPAQRSRWIAALPRPRIVLGGVGAAGLAALACLGLYRLRSSVSLSVTRDSEIWHAGDFTPPRSSEALCQPETRTQAIGGGIASVFSRSGECPAATLRARTFVMGDSHAWSYISMLKRLAFETGSEVSLLTKGGCSPLNLSGPEVEESGECRAFTAFAKDFVLERALAGDALVLPGLRIPRLGDQWVGFDPQVVLAEVQGETARMRRAAALVEALPFLERLGSAGIHLVLEAPKPVFRAPIFRCVDWFTRENPICAPGFEIPRETILALRAPMMESFAAIQASVPGTTIWDPLPALCPAEVCSVRAHGQINYFDGDHLNRAGTMLVYPELREHLGG